ncbi:MAG: hypothetical protein ACLFSB_08485, partial [Chitinispirillaceae bacterium]
MGKRKEKTAPSPKVHLGDEIWGIIFMAIGFLVFSSLISSLFHGYDNILGPFGRKMSTGLNTLFGTAPAYIIPTGILLIGISLFRGTALYLRTFCIWTIITLEICTLFAIHHLPVITTLNTFQNNIIGHVITYGLHFVFGRHTFGPYFLFSFALLITLAVSFNIDIKATLQWLWTHIIIFAQKIWNGLKDFGLKIRDAFNRKPQEKARIAPPPIEKKAPKADTVAPAKQQNTVTVEEKMNEEDQAEPSTESLEEVGKKILEEQLAQFRAKRNAPIKITTMEEELVQDELEEEIDESSTDDAALLDPELMSGDYEDFC